MNSVQRIDEHLPTPTDRNPHAQLDWIFKDKMAMYAHPSTKDNYHDGLVFYKRFLKATNNYNQSLERDPKFFIRREWDLTALFRVSKWIEATNIAGTEDYRSSLVIENRMSALRQTMVHAYDHGYIDRPVLDVSVPRGIRETLSRAAFSREEYEELFEAIGPLIAFSRGLLRGYTKTGKGRDPRVVARKGIPRGVKVLGQGWSCLAPNPDGGGYHHLDDNMRWYFENVMNCVPVLTRKNSKGDHKRFLAYASNKYGGLHQLYRRWGVSALIDQDIIIPLAVELIAETGLNVESLLSLRRDCFKEAHPLTGLPYLEYYKPRSGGQKELHLALYDQDRQSLGLKQKQSRVIGNTIMRILQLTEGLVSRASPKDRDYLFLYETNASHSFRKLLRVSVDTLASWTEKIVRENNLRGQDGKALVFTLSRFRPTKITEMVNEGYDFFDIMAVAGHSSVSTTLAYIDKLRSITDYQHTIHRELTAIKNNKRDYERKPLPIATTVADKPGNFVFAASYCHCKNPYDPPSVVKTSKTYHEGDACTYWNMCLQCDNVLVTEGSLPKLFAYRTEIERALKHIGDIPRQGELYKKIKMLLDEILLPGSMFSRETLESAERASHNINDVMDQFVYQGEQM